MRIIKIAFFSLFLIFFFNNYICFAEDNGLSIISEDDQSFFFSKDTDSMDDLTIDDLLKKHEFLKYDREKWNTMRDEKEGGFISKEKKEKTMSEEALSLTEEETKKEGFIEIDFPYESQLSISGRKLIAVNAEYVQYPNKTDTTQIRKSEGTNVEMDQELQVRVKGKVGRKVTVNVDYDDTREDRRDISVVYKGDPDEIVQEAAFGDINLSLPSTEFVSYNKNVFGIKLDAKYKRLGLMAIGSRTKGLTEVKKFKGSTTFEKKDIKDIEYIKRKYYRMEHSQIQRESEEVWIDFQDGKINEGIAFMDEAKEGQVWSSTTTYNGFFDKQFRGQDYTVDYEKGIITFRKSINSNCVIIVDYKKSGETTSIKTQNNNKYLIIKDESESLGYEAKNYYNLGSAKIIKKYEDDFILKIINLSRKEQNLSNYAIENIDYDLGILKFAADKPFSASAYNKSNPQHQFIIYTEYKYRVKVYMLRPDIILDSERVIMNSRLLQKDRDYMIDYESGFITFFNEEEIDADTNIEITYEYAPFGAQAQQTLVGSRLQYGLNTDPFFIGSTVMWSGTDTSSTVPNINSTPNSILVLDADTKIKLEHENFPLKTTLSGEIARSQFNPNLYKKAMIDNMEGVKLTSGIPMDNEYWQLSSNPTGSFVTLNGALGWYNEDVNKRDIVRTINPGWLEEIGEAEKTEVLVLGYNLNQNDEASMVYPVSQVGADYSDKMFLEMAVYGDGGGEELEIHFGGIDENADGKGTLGGKPKTEDLNEDGVLNAGEDIGWAFVHPDGSITRIGAGNGTIDTEDLDGDDVLDDKNTSGNFYTLNIDWVGWQFKRIPLNITDFNKDQWVAIKHARVTLRNKQPGFKQGAIKISSIELVGTKWDKGLKEGGSAFDTAQGEYLTIQGINNEDDQEYEDITGMEEYKDLYRLTIDGRRREQALSLKYTLNAGTAAYTKTTFTRAQDYTEYKKIKVLVFGGKAKNITFYMQFGTDDNNYYEYTRKVDWTGWRVCEISLADTNRDNIPDGFTGSEGNPFLNNIMQMKLGISTKTSPKITDGEIWINEIFVDGVGKKEGTAWKSAVDLELPGWFDAHANQKEIGADFETITTGSSKQDLVSTRSLTSGQQVKSQSGSLNVNRFKFVPMSFNVNRQKTETPDSEETSYSSLQQGRIEDVSGEARADIIVPRWPKLGLTYSENHSDSEYLLEERDTFTKKTSLSYNFPNKFSAYMPKKWDMNLLPKSMDLSYRRQDYIIGKTTSTYNYTDLTENFSAKVPFRFWKGLSINPSYSLEVIKAKENNPQEAPIDFSDKYRSQTAGIDSNLNIFSWFNPNFKYDITSSGSFDFKKNKIETITRNSTGQLNWAVMFKSIVPFLKPFESLNMNNSYRVEAGDSYEIKKDTDVAGIGSIWSDWDKLWLVDERDKLKLTEKTTNNEILPRSFSSRHTKKTTNNWKPLNFLNFNESMGSLKNMDWTITYTEIDDYKDTTGSELRTFTKTWPDLGLDLKDIEKLAALQKFVSNSQLSIKYSERTVETRDVSRDLTNNYEGYLRFNAFKDYAFSFDYTNMTNEALSIQGFDILPTRDGFTRKIGMQVGFFLNEWRFTPRYEYSSEEEINGEKQTKGVTIYTPSLKIYADFKTPGFRLPYIGLKLSNRLVLDSLIKYESRKGIDEAKDNTDTYSANVEASYNTSENLKVSLGLGGSYFSNRKKQEDNYWSINLLANLSIIF